MERLGLLISILFICGVASAKDWQFIGTIKEQVAPPEITIDEKPHKYIALELLKPTAMNVYSEDTDDIKLFRNVSSIQVGWKGNLNEYKNKKVSIVAKDCINSLNAHVYTDVMCEVSVIKTLEKTNRK